MLALALPGVFLSGARQLDRAIKVPKEGGEKPIAVAREIFKQQVLQVFQG